MKTEIDLSVLERILDDAAYIKQEDRQAIREAIAAPVPPAGDVEVLAYKYNFAGWVGTDGPQGWRLEFDTEKPAQFLFDDSRVKDYVELVDRAHVTRLQAENESLREKLRERVSSDGR